MRPVVLLLALTGCTGGGWDPFIPPCEFEVTILAPTEVSAFGFTAEEAVGWFGDEALFTARWTGRHSQTPPKDTFEIALGGLDSDVQQLLHTPTDEGTATQAECAESDTLTFTRSATILSEDGTVHVPDGAAEFQMSDFDLGTTRVAFVGEAVLTGQRLIEVDKALPNDLPPPESAGLMLVHDGVWLDYASIHVEGESYTAFVWKCDEQLKDRQECAELTHPSFR